MYTVTSLPCAIKSLVSLALACAKFNCFGVKGGEKTEQYIWFIDLLMRKFLLDFLAFILGKRGQ